VKGKTGGGPGGELATYWGYNQFLGILGQWLVIICLTQRSQRKLLFLLVMLIAAFDHIFFVLMGDGITQVLIFEINLVIF
jgi:hypothetical protein